nr:MAG TPA: hypothetical protein [Caudoviricetes sp.]
MNPVEFLKARIAEWEAKSKERAKAPTLKRLSLPKAN